jgi:phosphoribosylanthranilate isomerase
VSAVKVKICGLTHPEDAAAAVRAGADYLGLVFAESPRRVAAADVEPWLDDVRDRVEIVGVFRNAPPSEVLEIVDRLDLDFVQLHGEERGEAWHALPVRLIETRRVTAEGPAPARFQGVAWAELLDRGAGSGIPFDWTLATAQARARRTFLAGGLTPENVGEAIRVVGPFAVDVSSGVERAPGRKDPARLQAFLRAVRGEAEA